MTANAVSEQTEIIAEVVADTVEHEGGARRRHLIFLIGAVAIAALAWALEVRPDERVAFRGFSRWPLPHSCYSRVVFGVPCPGCGLTRSFVYLARGNWQAARQEHRLGWLLAGIVALQFPYRLWALSRGGRTALNPRLATALAIVLAVLMLLNWGLRFVAAG
ncbi:MAG TPA: DUF2752 domain-containing protein [Pirellulales bacterium]|nr:DUF2752 domain-containing protein [Pirellulales bacterium]